MSRTCCTGGVDPASRRRIQIFAVKLLVIIPVAVTLATQLGYPLLKTPWFFCLWHSVFAGMAALFRQQKHGAAVLTAWDSCQIQQRLQSFRARRHATSGESAAVPGIPVGDYAIFTQAR
jgi:hypothetical protein